MAEEEFVLPLEEGRSFDEQTSSSSSFLSRFLLYIGVHELFSQEVCFNSNDVLYIILCQLQLL